MIRKILVAMLGVAVITVNHDTGQRGQLGLAAS